MQKNRFRSGIILLLACAAAYFVLDVPVQMTGILPAYAGIKNFLPFTLGLFFGPFGVAGCLLGCIASGMVLGVSVLYECACIFITGAGMFAGWHILAPSHRVQLKTWRDYGRYVLLLCVLSAMCGDLHVFAAYALVGLFVGVPVNILFSSILYVQQVMPFGCTFRNDAEFSLTSEPESLDSANDTIEAAAEEHGIPLKRVFELQSCAEELGIRILKHIPDAEIKAEILFGSAISMRLNYSGTKYNPFMIGKDEDETDIMSLKIIKHRSLRASFSCSCGVNMVHVVL